jgi:hypothetical protein
VPAPQLAGCPSPPALSVRSPSPTGTPIPTLLGIGRARWTPVLQIVLHGAG